MRKYYIRINKLEINIDVNFSFKPRGMVGERLTAFFQSTNMIQLNGIIIHHTHTHICVCVCAHL
jgi:hypothetical protein